MKNPQTKHRVVCSFTDKEWTGRPDDGAGALFGKLSVVGLALCFLLMLLIPGLRDVSALVLFVATFATTFTALSILARSSRERAFLQGVTASVNEVLHELSVDSAAQLGADDLRLLLVTGKTRPLSVNGVAGLELKVIRNTSPKPSKHAKPIMKPITTTYVVLAATPPDYGVESFDRLLEAVTADPGASPRS
ncbi:hypothetical protein AU252_05030 [Pseudarthrobacter sulfonivorans]|uniref:Uncharacterized protein n=1 Tax=Pseudarthrobacter sulfonivorans TaxID=121292 RepID=A0A0U3QJY5_9MICC|nr:hypothetical protein [Pseudarthrobacter sulfonivorans]ALV40612.1 hypothetical protein AU252_05030 [Pseudarthrobacter sulfonivorans]